MSILNIFGTFSTSRQSELRAMFRDIDVVFPDMIGKIPSGTASLTVCDWRGNLCEISNEVLEIFEHESGCPCKVGEKYVLIRASHRKDKPIGWHPDNDDFVVCHRVDSRTATFCGIRKSRLRPTGEFVTYAKDGERSATGSN